MTSYPEFQLEVAQNQYLAPGATEVNAVLTVTADAPEEGQFTTSAAEIVIVDYSASMYRPSKLNAAKQATIAAIDGIRDGVEFAVIAGNESAKVVYPPKHEGLTLARADEETKAAARDAVAPTR